MATYMPANDDWRKKLEEDLAGLSSTDPVVEETDPTGTTQTTPSTTTESQVAPQPTAETVTQPQVMQPVATNPMSAPPPPPPPPAPAMTGTGVPQTMEMAGGAVAEDGGLSADLEAYAQQFMSEPNRFLSDLVTQTRDAGDLRRAESRREAGKNIDELISSRGIVGSNIEADIRSDLERSLAADVSAEERELLNMLASYEAQDRLAGGEFGLDVAQFGQAGEIAGRELDLRAQELMQQAQLEGRSLDLQEARDIANQELERDRLEQQESQFGRTLGISQQQVDLRAQELMQRAELEGRSLDLQEARDQANQELAREGMEHELKLQTNQLTQRESEFARSIGLDERQFVAQQEQFAQQFSEQVASRLQQDEQFRATLEAEDARFAIESGLQERALDLQQEGMTMDDAFRQASLEQERELTLGAQELTRLGIETEDAYRYAALEQDATFRQRAQDLQEQGMQLDEAYRRAELEFREADSERRDQSTRLAILIQAMDALGRTGSGIDMEDLVAMIMNETDLSDLGGSTDTALPGGDGTGTSVPDDGTWTPEDDRDAATWGPNNDMTYEEYLDWLATQDIEE